MFPGNRCFLLLVVLAGAVLAPAEAPGQTRAAALRENQRFRARQEAKMRGERSPFAVESVQPLKKPRNTIGSAPDADVRLDAPGVPAVAAVAEVRGNDVALIARSAVVRLDGRPVKERVMTFLDRVAIGPYRIQYRRPDGHPALRIANLKGAGMRSYRGLKYFPVDLKYRVPATFRPAGQKLELTVDSTQGGPQKLPLLGRLSFELEGRTLELDAFDEDEPDEFFVIFRDRTAGQETYPVGRYLYVKKPKPGSNRTVIDFNQAHNPLCAYGPLFFCPIPPKQDHLPMAIPAGEKTYDED